MEKEKKELEEKLASLQLKYDTLEKKEADKRAADEKKHSEEVAMLKKINDQLKVFSFETFQPLIHTF